MTYYFIFILCIFITIEFFLIAKIQKKINSYLTKLKSVKNVIFAKNLSDEEKEKQIKKISLNLFEISLIVFLKIFFIFSPFIIASILLPNFIEFSLKLECIVFSIFFSIFYLKFRNNFK